MFKKNISKDFFYYGPETFFLSFRELTGLNAQIIIIYIQIPGKTKLGKIDKQPRSFFFLNLFLSPTYLVDANLVNNLKDFCKLCNKKEKFLGGEQQESSFKDF